MNQKAIWFFTLLQEAHKLEARETKNLAIASSVSDMKDRDRRTYFNNLDRAQRDIIDNEDYSGLDKLKKEFKK